MGKVKLLYMVVVLSLIAAACGNGGSRRDIANDDVSKTNHELRAAALWNNFDFSDTTLIAKDEITEQTFANFITVIAAMDTTQRQEEIDTLLSRAMRGSKTMFMHFFSMAEKYLNNPNSPYRNEESFIPFLRFTIDSDSVDEMQKTRPRYLIELAMKNRKGTLSNNFGYIAESGSSGTLHNIETRYVLLYFFNAECLDCGRVKEYLSSSAIVNRLLSEKQLTILALYPDNDLGAWYRHIGENPSSWITARYASSADSEAFYLPAIPNLYLLDSRKEVLLKDATTEEIEYLLNVENRFLGITR